jgi:hypothetical protein
LRLVFMQWAQVLVPCHFVTYGNIAIKCVNVTKLTFTVVPCHLVRNTFEATFKK